VLVGVAELAVWTFDPVVLPVVVLAVRAYAYVSSASALGRALSVFALLFLPDVVVTGVRVPAELRVVFVVAAARWLVSAAAPVGRVTRERVLRSRRP
jgi:hypothetical protein